jgi:acetolactate synthase-1/2/3 large subunit
LLTIGTRLAIPQTGYDLSEFVRAAQVAMVDIDPLELTKLGDKVNLPILSDAKLFMVELMKCLQLQKIGDKRDWLKQCQHYRDRYPVIGPEHDDKEGFINSYRFMKKMEPHLKEDQLIVTDMGTALLCAHQVLSLKGQQRLMTSTGLGEMGYGLPAAIGASFARDKGEVLCLNCDGGMMMNLQELQTIVHHQLPIKIIIFNNDGYLMIKHTQKALFSGRYSGTDAKSGVSCPDYSAIAKAFNFPAYAIRTWQDFEQVMPQVQSAKGPVICEVFMHPEQLFLPKLSLAPKADGTIVSPPLEDLSPLLPREELQQNMIIGIHPKSTLL